MNCVIVVAVLATLSTAFAEPPSGRYLSTSGNHVDLTEAKARGFGSYSDSSYDTTGYGSGSAYSSPSSSSESYNSGFSSHSLGSQSGSSGYTGSSPVTFGSSSFNSQGSGFTPSYSPSLSYGAGSSAGFGGSYGSSSGSYGGPKTQGRPSKPQSQSYGAPTFSPGTVSSTYNTPLSHNEIEEQTDPSDPVKYEFGYEVNSPESGTEFGHRESRSGGVTTGQYHVLLPDGRLQTVEYLADKAGYRPTVTYQQTDRVATQIPVTQSRAFGKTPTTASPSSSGYGTLSLTQSSHGSPIARQTSHSSAGYGPIQRSQSFAAADYHGKPSERASPIIQALTENDQV